VSKLTTSPNPPRALRADAELNRQKILDAAQRTFADQGFGVGLADIAQAAGVGVGTIYRRFKDKDELVQLLFEQSMDEVITLADQILSDDDGSGLRRFLEQAFALMATNRALQQILTGSASAAAGLSEAARMEIEPRVAALAARAHGAGRLRRDLGPRDLPIIQVMVSAAIDATLPVRSDLWQRYVALLLDTLEPRPGDRPLPGSSPTDPELRTIVNQRRAPAEPA
jgi:AcrR family transcriptional regulator